MAAITKDSIINHIINKSTIYSETTFIEKQTGATSTASFSTSASSSATADAITNGLATALAENISTTEAKDNLTKLYVLYINDRAKFNEVITIIKEEITIIIEKYTVY